MIRKHQYLRRANGHKPAGILAHILDMTMFGTFGSSAGKMVRDLARLRKVFPVADGGFPARQGLPFWQSLLVAF